MKVQKDLTISGFAQYLFKLEEKKINKLKQEIGLLKLKAELLMKKDVFEHSSQNCKIRKGKLVYLPHKI